MNDITVAWFHDHAAINIIVNYSDIAPFVLEGEAFSAPDSHSVKYIAVYNSSALVGVFVLVQKYKFAWEIHTCLTAQCRGRDALLAGKLTLELIFGTLAISCLIANVPVCLRNAVWYCKRMGFKLVGVMPHCFNCAGMQDCAVYALTREEYFKWD